ncbi:MULTISPECIES: MFS transporter [unclassified Salinibacterium]|uniref:MFS transporter n=1 Tax=unclassified Salinibacterium TaxID=2632331 RepID=UPI0018CC9947|nr:MULTISPECIES: MFS transporter [unclassified Salinibacterium]MBH0052603.1 MFS transporter [Salinibacterium sp. SWN139]MBH0081861.1 MFS transporter [Salinibacterium sp. SWN167]
MSAMFRSLRLFNYRLWIIGAVVSNTGAWMQRTAQDWIVLTDLTDYDAAALGFTMALQFGPMLLLMPLTGIIADRFDRRTVLLWTQFSQFALALGLGILVISGHVQLWQVYVFALLLGVATAIDAPARQAFVSELVSDKDLPNAVALNSMSFQTARLIGPAVAGVLVAAIGAGPVFIVNAASFAGVLASLWFMRRGQLFPVAKLGRAKGQIRDGLRYVRGRPDILIVLVMVFLVGTFGFNFPVFIATMATGVFGKGAAEFGLLSSMMAVGAVVGSLLAARRERARFGVVIVGSAFFGLACLLAAFAPSYWTFGAALTIIGVFSLTMMTTANAYVQTSTTPIMRGRVMALYLAIFAGGTPIGAPIVGWAANELGPRWALGIGALSGLLAAAAAIIWLVYSRGMRVGRVPESRFRLRLRFPPEPTPDEERELATQEIAIVETTTRRTS